MQTTRKKITAKKVNYMMNPRVIEDIEATIPKGERSHFVNEVVEEGLIRYKRKKAFSEMEKLRQELNLSMSTAEIIRLKNEGRR